MDEDILDLSIAPEESTPEPSELSSLQNRRERTTPESEAALIQRFNEKLSGEADPEAALLGRINAVLQTSFFRLAELTESLGEECATGPEHRAVFMQGTDMSLRISRQIGQFAQLRLIFNTPPRTTAFLRQR